MILQASKADEIWPTSTKTPEPVEDTQGRWTLQYPQACLDLVHLCTSLWQGLPKLVPDYWPSKPYTEVTEMYARGLLACDHFVFIT